MPGKILLISTNRCSTPDQVFPLGLSYVNRALRRAGHETCWFDYQVDNGAGWDSILAREKPNHIGISLRNIDDVLIRKQETYHGEVVSLCQSLRQKTDCPIILGGSGFSIFPKELLAITGAAFGICGEGDENLVRLLAALEENRSPADIPGLVFRKGSEILLNPPKPSGNVSGLEDADRPERLIQHYLNTSGMLNVQTQRGCSWHCCYCTYPVIEGRAHRWRQPESVAAELEMLDHAGVRYVFIVDSVFNSTPGHVTEICEAILRHGLKIQWGCFLRPQGLSAELIRLMARAGLSHIEFGTDSFCDEVLRASGKGFSFSDVLSSSELAQQENIDYCHFLICGGPGETRETLRTGFENSRQLKGGVMMAVAGMRIYPGTALYQRALQEERITAETDLLKPVYYLAPELDAATIFEQLNAFSAQCPNWIAGDPGPAYARLVERLRQRRVVGPLWSYFSMLQKLWPSTPVTPPVS